VHLAALKVHLADDEQLAATSAVNLEAYNYYLQGLQGVRSRDGPKLEAAIEQFRRAVEIEPDYAAAWAGLAAAYRLSSDIEYGTIPDEESFARAREYVDKALSLNPNQWQAHAVNAYLYLHADDPWSASASIERAIAGNPSEGMLYGTRGTVLSSLGFYDEALNSRKLAYQVDPMSNMSRSNWSIWLAGEGRYAEARALAEPGILDPWVIEAQIAGYEERADKVVHAFEQGIAASENQQNTWMQTNLAKTYFFELAEPELAYEYAPSQAYVIAIKSVLSPEATYPALQSAAMTMKDRAVDFFLVINLYMQDRCEEALPIQEKHGFLSGPIRGLPDGGLVMVIEQHQIAAWCLARTGEQDRSQKMAQKILAYFDEAEINGHPPIHYNRAITYMTLGEPERALALLAEAGYLDWVLLRYPWWDSVRDTDTFQAVSQQVWNKVNEQRALLGNAKKTGRCRTNRTGTFEFPAAGPGSSQGRRERAGRGTCHRYPRTAGQYGQHQPDCTGR
jgi:tetratricopeptide (TPR) repeat protein